MRYKIELRNISKIIVLIYLMALFNINGLAEENIFNSRIKQSIKPHLYMGLALGRETFISMFLPKIGVMGTVSFGKQKKNSSFGVDFPKYGMYGAADLTIFGLFQVALSMTTWVGFKIGPLTIDNSIAFVRGFPDGKKVNDDFYLRTINPKIGLKIGIVWLKFGPSYTISGKWDQLDNWFKIKNNFFNFDLNFVMDI
ncbi:MAG: hypothetical protein IPM74_04640 [Crocinitomicaceae bacterium]|nr:hypothetical protein [Crocinitomicaceae bacterium]MBK8925192.1 hypothetical protein [Crocinitomicaceae bacterium]